MGGLLLLLGQFVGAEFSIVVIVYSSLSMDSERVLGGEGTSVWLFLRMSRICHEGFRVALFGSD